MVLIQALKNLDSGLEIAVTPGQTSSLVSCISELKYYDILGEDSPILKKIKKRIQVIKIPSSRLELALYFIKNSWKIEGKKVHIIIGEEEMKSRDYLKDEKFKIISDYNEDDIIIKACSFFLINLRDEAFKLNNSVDSIIQYLPPNCYFYPHILVLLLTNKTKFLKVNSSGSSEFLGQMDMDKVEVYKKEINAQYLDEILMNHTQGQEISKTGDVYDFIRMYCDNVGQKSTEYAKLHNINQILFVDTRSGNLFLKQQVSESVQNHSGNHITVIFLRHEQFLSGVGALIEDSSSGIHEKSWTENYSESSGPTSQMCAFQGFNAFQLTLDSLDNLVTHCPLLLNPIEYFPDTQNLSDNSSAREYWLNCISEGVSLGAERMAINAREEAVENIRKYKDLVLNRLAYLKINHQAYGDLSMRILQDTLENIKRETGLITMYEKRKQLENATALKELTERLRYLDSLDHSSLCRECIKSLLAGNMFDWGAKEVAKMMSSGQLNFYQAMDKLPERPWLVDDLDEWSKRFKEHNYNCVMIIVDNSGYDLIIGVIPFVREFLRRKAKVVICANSEPIINDVTFYELVEILHEIENTCPVIKKAIKDQTLTVMDMGKSSCCLDLSFIDRDIAKVMEKVDLLIIEGMGRAVHTNLNADFNCDTLRVAVIKDHWLSKQFGGGEFACICKFTHGVTS